MSGEYRYHPIAEKFPRMSPEQFSEFKKDIRENGLKDPILRFQEQIADGRHRYEACLTENVEPRFADFGGTEQDLIRLVMSRNLQRRNLTEKQRITLAKEFAKELLQQTPKPSRRAIAKETGLSHDTVNTVADALEAENPNGRLGHYSEAPIPFEPFDPMAPTESGEGAAIVSEGVAEQPGATAVTAPSPEPRVEATGRKARGRQPMTPEQKEAAREKRLKERSEAARSRSALRDDKVSRLIELIASSRSEMLAAAIQIICDHGGYMQAEWTKHDREERLRKLAAALNPWAGTAA